MLCNKHAWPARRPAADSSRFALSRRRSLLPSTGSAGIDIPATAATTTMEITTTINVATAATTGQVGARLSHLGAILDHLRAMVVRSGDRCCILEPSWSLWVQLLSPPPLLLRSPLPQPLPLHGSLYGPGRGQVEPSWSQLGPSQSYGRTVPGPLLHPEAILEPLGTILDPSWSYVGIIVKPLRAILEPSQSLPGPS